MSGNGEKKACHRGAKYYAEQRSLRFAKRMLGESYVPSERAMGGNDAKRRGVPIGTTRHEIAAENLMGFGGIFGRK